MEYENEQRGYDGLFARLHDARKVLTRRKMSLAATSVTAADPPVLTVATTTMPGLAAHHLMVATAGK